VLHECVTQRGGSRRVRNDEAMGLLRYCLRHERSQSRAMGLRLVGWVKGAATALRLVGSREACGVHFCQKINV